MNCRQARDLFSARLDRELEPEGVSDFERHLRTCGCCADQWTAFARTVQLVRSLPAVEPDPAFVGHVFDRVRAYEAGNLELADPPRRIVPEPVRVLWSSLSDTTRWSGAFFPARLAGAVALGACLGFFVSEKVWSPQHGFGGHAPLTADTGQVTPGSQTVGSRTGTDYDVRRPFADLAAGLADRPAGRTSDSTDPIQGPSPADPPGNQVRLSVSGGRPQVTF
jgi:hypothetical protein